MILIQKSVIDYYDTHIVNLGQVIGFEKMSFWLREQILGWKLLCLRVNVFFVSQFCSFIIMIVNSILIIGFMTQYIADNGFVVNGED